MPTEISMKISFPDEKICEQFSEYCLGEFGSEPIVEGTSVHLILHAHGDRIQAMTEIENLKGTIFEEQIEDDY